MSREAKTFGLMADHRLEACATDDAHRLEACATDDDHRLEACATDDRSQAGSLCH